ncbi:response regulator transcription factor [Hydrogenimonas thermophila]|uniref:response regulator transcription factor n=1 Tax=Hydrogenimonas thermophila TaxID=223786 RepID=UPI0029372D67|nr:response regulator transcription factor [Hydrogenimonas thermophila]WOE69376.1 response regulator transcription factor [Hydrogenimonas thermophila]WOE71886.1 response regulator transcription factor [Hydrogenimonas thermophila]
MALIAIIEDEQDLLDLLEYHLQKEGYETFAAISVKPIEKLLEEETPDLMIVDRNLPGVEGSEFVQQLRSEGYNIPVIFLTAKVSDTEIEEGFLRGGDDYVTKPFNVKELMHRVRAILRRSKPEESSEIIYRDITIKPKSYEVFIDDKKIDLTRLEFKLLLELVTHKNMVLSRDQLLEKVWGDDGDYQDRTVNVAVNRLKEKIDPDKSKNYIKSIRGVGYQVC